jgi:nicotinate-nucleotide adenylyltransferase
MKIALFGGTFDPIHNGHVYIVNSILNSGLVDAVVVSPAHTSPHKIGKKVTSSFHRKNMIRLALQNIEDAHPWYWEIDREGVSYTSDALDVVSYFFPKSEIRLMIGMDNYLCFDKWYKYDYILEHYKPIVFGRTGYEMTHESKFDVDFVQCRTTGISSTEIREKLAAGEDVNTVPPVVLDYIKGNKLYIDNDSV